MSELSLDRGGAKPAEAVRRPAPEQPAVVVEELLTYYTDAGEWVDKWLLAAHEVRSAEHVNWCPEWYEHPEVFARIDGLWRAWEIAKMEGPPSPLNWWRDHFDVHWAVVTGSSSPMSQCKEGGHRDGEYLTTKGRPPVSPEQFIQRPAWMARAAEEDEEGESVLMVLDQAANDTTEELEASSSKA